MKKIWHFKKELCEQIGKEGFRGFSKVDLELFLEILLERKIRNFGYKNLEKKGFSTKEALTFSCIFELGVREGYRSCEKRIV